MALPTLLSGWQLQADRVRTLCLSGTQLTSRPLPSCLPQERGSSRLGAKYSLQRLLDMHVAVTREVRQAGWLLWQAAE